MICNCGARRQLCWNGRRRLVNHPRRRKPATPASQELHRDPAVEVRTRCRADWPGNTLRAVSRRQIRGSPRRTPPRADVRSGGVELEHELGELAPKVLDALRLPRLAQAAVPERVASTPERDLLGQHRDTDVRE